MRQKLNENPVAQIAVIAVLMLVVGIFLMKSLGGGSGEGATEESVAVASPEEAAGALEGSAPAASSSSIAAPADRPLPQEIRTAYDEDKTVALLIYRSGGIDDRLVTVATGVLSEMPGVALFAAPAGDIARFAEITGPLGVNQAPALIVVRPHRLNGSGPAVATVDYGFRGAADVRQAVIDAGYRGPDLGYAPN